MIKKVILGIFIVLAALGIIALVTGAKISQFIGLGKMAETMVMPPETVTSAEAIAETWPVSLQAVGTVVAVQGVQLSSELSGSVTSIQFESGQEVRLGDVLVKLDTSTEETQLRSAEVALELARVDLERSKELLGNKVISQAEQDTKKATFDQASAQVDNLRSTAAKKTITAPFSGTVGLRRVNKGEYLTAGTPIASLQAMTPVYVDFTIPQQELSRVTQGLKVVTRSDAYDGREFDGHVSALDSDVDSSTRSIKIRATVPNSDKLLRPGMFVTVEVIMPQPLEVVRVPATAVAYEPYGDSVYIIEKGKDDKLVLRRQVVRLGEARGDFVAVTQGVKAGEKVASTGVFKLRNEMPVVVDNTLQPEMKLEPTPKEG